MTVMQPDCHRNSRGIVSITPAGRWMHSTINNAASYGEFFRMQGKEPYTITVQVRRGSSAAPIEAKFDFKP